MADNTSIEWTDATWNPVRGCTRVSPGCGGPNHQGGCYAEKIAARFSGPGQPFEGFAERGAHGGRWTGKVALIPEMLLLPLRWRKPRRIFVNSMSDLFHEALPDEAIDKVFAVMALCNPNHLTLRSPARGVSKGGQATDGSRPFETRPMTAAPQGEAKGGHVFQILTKRSDRMRAYLNAPHRLASINGAIWSLLGTPRGSLIHHGGNWRAALPLPNVWLGVSAEDQPRAEERIPDLLATPAAVRFASCEPLLGAIDLTDLDPTGIHAREQSHGWSAIWRDNAIGRPWLDWVIAGGESGPSARPAHPDWIRSLRNQCVAAGVPFFFKQWGEFAPSGSSREKWILRADGSHDPMPTPEGIGHHPPRNGATFMYRVGKAKAGCHLDGRTWREFPLAGEVSRSSATEGS